ncbi:MAG: site-specific integrase, partial [Gammaproteobacteria bacterium]|nr:site-specific integrase [Gammaproteobacteria bacterium]
DVAELLGTVKTVNGPIMANRVLSCVQKVYAWAVKNPKISDIKFNPSRDVERPSPEVERERVYNEVELRALWKDFAKRGALGTVYKIVLVTGQRLGEVVGMEWSEIDGDIWTIPGVRIKNKRIHVVPLSELATELIEAQRGRHDRFVFPSPTKKEAHIYPASKIAGDVKKGSKVTDFRSHDLRRTMSTESTRLGFSRFLVDRLLNHTEQGVGRVYDRHDYLKEKTEITDAWARRLRNIIAGGKVVQISR